MRPLKLTSVLYWTTPSLLCLLIYWYGLKAWFQMDDFAWLSLHTLVHDFSSFLQALFQPMAQGTVRPLSERLFFLSFWELFGMDARPYRALVFATQFCNLVLLTVVTRRITGSMLAGWLAPVLWVASPVIYEPMSWTAAYNQILCSWFLLLQFYLLLRLIDTDRSRYYIGLWITFLLGFGALELNVVFPAIAAVYLFLFAQRHLLKVAPMFAVSAAYTLWHRSVASSLSNAVYAMDFSPASLLTVFVKYAALSLSPYQMAKRSEVSELQLYNAGAVVLLGIAVFLFASLRRKQWLSLFCLAWYVMALAPFLPLASHVSDYYLTVPIIGLVMLGAWAVSEAWRSHIAARALAIAALVLFAGPGIWQASSMARYYFDQSMEVRRLVRGVSYAHKLHPGKVIVLKGVSNDLFWSAIYDKPQRALGWNGLYVAGETERNVVPFPEKGSIADRFLPEAVALDGIRAGSVVVYDVSQGQLRNVTETYRRVLLLEQELPPPHMIDAGLPVFDRYLKEGWHSADGGRRWSMKRAVVELRAPASDSGKLAMSGIVSALHTSTGPLTVVVFADGKHLGTREIPRGAQTFEFTFDLPARSPSRPSMLVTIETDRTIVAPPDLRAVGLLFGTIEVTP